MAGAPLVFTIGHSTHPIDVFIHLLLSNEVEHLVDVRTVPRSRRNPQFNKENLPDLISQAGIEYTHIQELGGFRKPKDDSPNKAWRNESFRGYADYMLTDEFEQALLQLIGLAETARVAIMCAESLPWRCHRSLVADVLLVRGFPVENILSTGKREPHKLKPFARVNGLQLTYPGEDGEAEEKGS